MAVFNSDDILILKHIVGFFFNARLFIGGEESST